MAAADEISKEGLERLRDVSAATYLKAYIFLMMRELKLEKSALSDEDGINVMVVQMVEPINRAVEAAWCALMEDEPGMERALSQFGESLDDI